MPALERLVAYGRTVRKTQTRATHENWQVELLQALELAPVVQYPSAPLSWFGIDGNSSLGLNFSGSIFHADPIRMEISGDGLGLSAAEAWTLGQLNDLKLVFAEQLGSADASLEIASQRLFVKIAGPAVVDTTSVQEAERVSVRDALPRGLAAAGIRRLMTEIQMLMHDKYSDAGAANGVWLWGNGALAPPQRRSLPALWTNDAYSRGVYALNQAEPSCGLLPKSFHALNGPAHSLVVIRGLDFDDLEKNWMEPVLNSLHSGRLDRVHLRLDGFGLNVNRSVWQRAFARPRSLEEMFQ